MYATPILLPQQSNREDFLQTIALFDDLTGQPIDVSGRALALPGDFAGHAWTVTVGNIVTASVTQLTIKDYPIGSEMQAVALTVGLNLAVLAGSPVTISDASGKNTMTGYVTSYAPSTGALVCQVGCAFEFEIRSHGSHDGYCDYGPFSGIAFGGGVPVISAQLGAGITVIDVGILRVRIAAATMSRLRHKTYGVGMTAFDGYDTRQLFIGKLPILSGGVNTMPLSVAATANPFGLP